MDIDRLEKYGAFDYYQDLLKFIVQFINRNYPISKEDMENIVNDRESTVMFRKEIMAVMKHELFCILEEVIEANRPFVDNPDKALTIPTLTVKDYQDRIFQYEQRILEKVYLWKQSSLSPQTDTTYMPGKDINRK